MKRIQILFFLAVLLFSSCTIEKRHFRNGFYIQKSHAEISLSAEQNKKLSVPVPGRFAGSDHPLVASEKSFALTDSLLKPAPGIPRVKRSITTAGKILTRPSHSVSHPPKRKDNYRSRPFLIISAGILTLLILTFAAFVFFLGGWWIIISIAGAIAADSLAFLAILSINPDDIDELSPVKRILVKTGQVMLWIVLVALFPISILWFLIYVNFMIRGDMS